MKQFFHLILCSFIAAATVKAADKPAAPAQEIRSLMQRVNAWQVAHPRMKADDRNWERGTWYAGVTEAQRATGDEKFLQQALDWGNLQQWQVGTEGSGANKLFCAMTWVECYLLKKDPAMLKPTLDWLATDAPNSPGGAKLWFGHAPAPFDGPLYSDSLFAMPVFALLHKATGDSKHLETLDHFARTVTDELFDKEEGLYYRDGSFIGKKTPAGRKILWSRGNGWVFAGLPRTLECLPADDPRREFFLTRMRTMAAALAKCQGGDGFWRPNLADPEHVPVPESSGTAFFCHGMAWGIRNGVLDKETYLPVVKKAWTALAGAVSPTGMVQWGQQVGDRPSNTQQAESHEYVTGAFLLAASEVLRLTEAGLLKTDATSGASATPLLPPPAITPGPLPAGAHPFASEINAFLTRQEATPGFRPTGLKREDYLRVIEGQVKAMRAYQDPDGRIIDPVEKVEKFYATPCYAHSVAVLAHSGHCKDAELIESGMNALDAATADMASNNAPGGHGDFFTWPAMFAFELFQAHASAGRRADWEGKLRAVNPKKLYRVHPGSGNNWGVVNLAGEFMRHRQGFTTLDYVEASLAGQVRNFTELGMYDENGNPFPYDHFSRYYLAGMLDRGYVGTHQPALRELLWRAAWVSLFMQSPCGEMPTGFRSSHHIWNEAEQCVTFELYAAAYAKAGRFAEAGAFKRAARLSLQSVQDWIRPDGSGFIVKNRYPIEAKHGYEVYSAHSCYNMLACSMLAQAWQFADDSVIEKPAPADTGGFVIPILDPFRKIFANAGGTYIEYDIRGDHKYNPTGLLRIHVKGGHPQLGPSDGCAPLYSGAGVNIATGPAWQEPGGQWRSLAELSPPTPTVEILEQEPARTRFRVSYARLSDGKGPAPVRLTQTILVEPSGVTVTDELTGTGERMRVTWPMLVSDGAAATQIEMSGNSASLKLGGRGNRFTLLEPAGVILSRSGKPVSHRNGLVETATAEFAGKHAVYRITAFPQP
jgi:rhamnogalacturonyl hydrolase YesR